MRVPLDAGTHARTHVGVGVHIICVAPLRYHMRFSALLATRSIWVSPMLYITHTFIHARARARAHTHILSHHTRSTWVSPMRAAALMRASVARLQVPLDRQETRRCPTRACAPAHTRAISTTVLIFLIAHHVAQHGAFFAHFSSPAREGTAHAQRLLRATMCTHRLACVHAPRHHTHSRCKSHWLQRTCSTASRTPTTHAT